ncbi:MAG: nucleoside recognition domain-containing protein [Christensenellales bacterium]
MSAYILPAFIIIVIIIGIIKKVAVFDCFATGAKEGLNLIVSVFPFLCAIMIAVELFSMSGLSKYFSKILEPVLTFLGIPSQLCELLIILPLSGNGSIAMLENIYTQYGVDSYIARCASVIVSASETVFYIATMYFSTTKVKKLRYAIPVALFSTYAGVIISCLLCRFI